ncbi:MAG: DUF433 domain-containing protein [Halodesulfurarchaeum sp.]
MNIVEDPDHSDGAPTIEGTGIRVKDIASASEHSGYEPDEITQLYPDLSLVEGSGVDHAGIIYVQQAGRDIGDVVKAIDSHLENRAASDRGIHYC